MNITVQELKRLGYRPVLDLMHGRIEYAYQSPDRMIILYWFNDDVFWYLQTFFDYPSFYGESPFTTFDQLRELLRSIGH